MIKLLKHLHLIRSHKRRVLFNALHMGIFFHCLKHDLSKYTFKEFFTSVHYFDGHKSPVINERNEKGGYSSIAQHHTKRNAHHYEYWTDFDRGDIVIKTMPWKNATEYVADMLSATKTYNKKEFNPASTLEYYLKHHEHTFITKATDEYIVWCLTRYRDLGFKGLNKKDTKKKYEEIISLYPDVERIKTSKSLSD